MRAEDKLIGMTIFGWTEEKTLENNWFDEFFGVWRPKPKCKDKLYPSWSMSGKFATQLIEKLIKLEVEINIHLQADGLIGVYVKHELFDGYGSGPSLPEALADSIGSLTNYLPAITSLNSVKQALERN